MNTTMRLKVSFGKDTRAWRSATQPPLYEDLEKYIVTQWGSVLPDEKDRVIQYKDDEGDLMTITSQQDLNDALTMAKELQCKSLKLVVASAEHPVPTAASEYAHSIMSRVPAYTPKAPQEEPAPKRARSVETPDADVNMDDGKDTPLADQVPPIPSLESFTILGKTGLKKFLTPHDRYTCDVCKTRQPAKALMIGCRVQDWDCCGKCAMKLGVFTDTGAPKQPEAKKSGAPCPWKELAKAFVAEASDEKTQLHKQVYQAVGILFASLQSGDNVQVAFDTILGSCDAIREHKLIQMVRPFIYGYTEKFQRMAPILLMLGPDVVKQNIGMILKAAHQMLNNKGDVYMDLAPHFRKCCPEFFKALEGQMKNGTECTIDLADFLGSMGVDDKPEAPPAVEMTDTDGDKIRFVIENGKLVEYVNGKREIEVQWLKVNEFNGVVIDNGGKFVIHDNEREEKLRALHKLCEHAGVGYHTMGHPRFHHGGRRHGGRGGGWWRKFMHGGRGGGRGRCGGWGGPGRHGPFGRGGRGGCRGWRRHCGGNGKAAHHWQKWGEKMKKWGRHMEKHGEKWAKMGQQWAEKFIPKNMQKPAYNMKFDSHENVAQRAVFMPGQVLMKGWRVTNCGLKNWEDCELIFVKGNGELLMADTKRFAVPVIEPNQDGVVSAMFNTPQKPGRYKAVFRMQKLGPNKTGNGQRFGEQLFLDIRVVATQEEFEQAMIQASLEQAEQDKVRRRKAALQEAKQAKRNELMNLRKETKAAIQSTRNATKEDIQQMRSKAHAQAQAVKDKHQAEIQRLKAELHQAKAAKKAVCQERKLERKETKLESRIAKLAGKMEKATIKGKTKKQAKLELRRARLLAELDAVKQRLENPSSGSDSEDGATRYASSPRPPVPSAPDCQDDSPDDTKDDAPQTMNEQTDAGATDPFSRDEDAVSTPGTDRLLYADSQSEEADLVVNMAEQQQDADEEDDAEAPLLDADANKANSPSSDGFEVIDAAEIPQPMHDADDVPTPYQYADQLQALAMMGFQDLDVVKFALEANDGDLDKSVAMILAQMGHSA